MPARWSQVRIVDGSGVVVARVDHLVDERVVVEFDGLVKYAGAEGRDALAAEKAREDLLRSLGYEVVRLTWADLDRPQRVDALVRAARDRARARAQR
jgi:very-short-patch-repair endonuclease